MDWLKSKTFCETKSILITIKHSQKILTFAFNLNRRLWSSLKNVKRYATLLENWCCFNTNFDSLFVKNWKTTSMFNYAFLSEESVCVKYMLHTPFYEKKMIQISSGLFDKLFSCYYIKLTVEILNWCQFWCYQGMVSDSYLMPSPLLRMNLSNINEMWNEISSL